MKNFISFVLMSIVTVLVIFIFVILLGIILDVDIGGSDEIDYTYSNVEVGSYFYNQLPEEAQIIYRGLKENEEEMKSGVYAIGYGDVFADILVRENGDKALAAYFQVALQAYRYDNPQIFYMETSKMVLNMEQTSKLFSTTYDVYIDPGDNANYFSSNFATEEQVKAAVIDVEVKTEKILANFTGTTYDKIKAVHDYLVDNLSYDSSLEKENIYNIYGSIVNNEAVCEGYAEAFQYMLNQMGIECVYVVGKGTSQDDKIENHAWNYVQIDNNWYAVDVTWDDPIIIGSGTVSSDVKYKYFLKGSYEFDKNHEEEFDVDSGNGILSYPTLQTNNY